MEGPRVVAALECAESLTTVGLGCVFILFKRDEKKKQNGAVSQWEESFFPKTSVAIVILFWLKWAGYLAVAGLNLLAQISDRISPYGV